MHLNKQQIATIIAALHFYRQHNNEDDRDIMKLIQEIDSYAEAGGPYRAVCQADNSIEFSLAATDYTGALVEALDELHYRVYPRPGVEEEESEFSLDALF